MVYKDDLRQGLKELVEIIDSDFRRLNTEQKRFIENNYNTYINFEYTEDGGYIFVMDRDNFDWFECLIGMESERDNIESIITINKSIMVTYSYDSTRAEQLINTLNELSEE
jgi:hypothetical protein